MATTKKTTRRAAPRALAQAQLIHEHLNQQHRIVRVEPGKPAVGGEWVHETDIAKFDTLRASTAACKVPVPIGIFRVTTVDHVVL